VPRTSSCAFAGLALLAALAAAAAPAGAEVKVLRGADGKLVMSNPTPAARPQPAARPLALSAVRRAVYEPLIARHSEDHDLDPRLVRAVIQAESAFNERARSHKGAIGLMQLMPATALVLAVDDPYDPEQNLRGGTAYLKQLVDRYEGRLELAVAAYNAGPGSVDRYRGIPPYRETREYVRRVMSLYEGRDVPAAEIGRVQVAPRVARDASGRLVLSNQPSD
jgi:soluble lytic murein transglycosylase-like protein